MMNECCIELIMLFGFYTSFEPLEEGYEFQCAICRIVHVIRNGKWALKEDDTVH